MAGRRDPRPWLSPMNPDELQRALLDPTAPIPHGWPAGAWGVLLLFLVPIGGGIPAGVLLARDRGIAWPIMMALYFVSDVILACTFEPILRLVLLAGRSIPILGRVSAGIRTIVRQTTARYGTKGGPLALVLIAFGVDPMTGRAAAHAAGHGFLPGWAIAITGDMFYFAVLMVSTLWLNELLGDERWTVGGMLVFMMVLPSIVRRWQERREKAGGS
ncbi:MAG: hypothetical protein ACKO2K_17790 [Alphaproteobacteria bacterium]